MRLTGAKRLRRTPRGPALAEPLAGIMCARVIAVLLRRLVRGAPVSGPAPALGRSGQFQLWPCGRTSPKVPRPAVQTLGKAKLFTGAGSGNPDIASYVTLIGAKADLQR